MHRRRLIALLTGLGALAAVAAIASIGGVSGGGSTPESTVTVTSLSEASLTDVSVAIPSAAARFGAGHDPARVAVSLAAERFGCTPAGFRTRKDGGSWVDHASGVRDDLSINGPYDTEQRIEAQLMGTCSGDAGRRPLGDIVATTYVVDAPTVPIDIDLAPTSTADTVTATVSKRASSVFASACTFGKLRTAGPALNWSTANDKVVTRSVGVDTSTAKQRRALHAQLIGACDEPNGGTIGVQSNYGYALFWAARQDGVMKVQRFFDEGSSPHLAVQLPSIATRTSNNGIVSSHYATFQDFSVQTGANDRCSANPRATFRVLGSVGDADATEGWRDIRASDPTFAMPAGYGVHFAEGRAYGACSTSATTKEYRYFGPIDRVALWVKAPTTVITSLGITPTSATSATVNAQYRVQDVGLRPSGGDRCVFPSMRVAGRSGAWGAEQSRSSTVTIANSTSRQVLHVQLVGTCTEYNGTFPVYSQPRSIAFKLTPTTPGDDGTGDDGTGDDGTGDDTGGDTGDDGTGDDTGDDGAGGDTGTSGDTDDDAGGSTGSTGGSTEDDDTDTGPGGATGSGSGGSGTNDEEDEDEDGYGTWTNNDTADTTGGGSGADHSKPVIRVIFVAPSPKAHSVRLRVLARDNRRVAKIRYAMGNGSYGPWRTYSAKATTHRLAKPPRGKKKVRIRVQVRDAAGNISKAMIIRTRAR